MALEPFKFAKSDKEAAEKYEKYKSIDPFPSIAPALLNSADIMNYVAATGMIFPFDSSEDRLKETLKPASYRIDTLGLCAYWDENDEKKEIVLNERDALTIKPNSIIFVGVEPMFRLPDYIALRFNLQITHVYKGLLVGTGPLVDPGFVGKLWLPLHNLTANTYTIYGGEEIIWMEFTKLSTVIGSESRDDLVEKKGIFKSFPLRKNFKELNYYFDKAVGRDKSIRSSIPVAIKEASDNAQKAADAAKNASEEIQTIKEIANKTETNFNNLQVTTETEIEILKSETNKDIDKFKVIVDSEIEKFKSQALIITPVLSGVVAIFLLILTYSTIIYPINNLVSTASDRNNQLGVRMSEINQKINDTEKRIILLESSNEKIQRSIPLDNFEKKELVPSNPVVYDGQLNTIRQEIEQNRLTTEKAIDDKSKETEVSFVNLKWWLGAYILISLLIVGLVYRIQNTLYKRLKTDADKRLTQLLAKISSQNETTKEEIA